MATHLSTDIPQVADFGISIEPNKEIFVNVKPDITIAEEAVHGFPLVNITVFCQSIYAYPNYVMLKLQDKRLCFFPFDYPLKYYKYYTSANCVDEAIAEETLHACGCVRYYMPRKELLAKFKATVRLASQQSNFCSCR